MKERKKNKRRKWRETRKQTKRESRKWITEKKMTEEKNKNAIEKIFCIFQNLRSNTVMPNLHLTVYLRFFSKTVKKELLAL